MKHVPRRAVIGAAAALLGAGCFGGDGGTETEPEGFNNPPGYREESVTDVMIVTPENQSAEATVTAGSWTETVPVEADDRWKSPDVIGPDRETTVRIEAAGTSLRMDWPAEGDTQQAVSFFVDPEDGRIRGLLMTTEESLAEKRSTATPSE